MRTQKAIAVMMVVTSSVLTAWVSYDIAYPVVLCTLGLLGLQRRFTWDIRPEKRVMALLLLFFLAVMFVLHYRYVTFASRVSYNQGPVLAWQTMSRYFLASMVLMLFLGAPQRLPSSLGLFHIAVSLSAGQVLLLDDMYVAFRLLELLSVILVVLYAVTSRGAVDLSISRRTAVKSPRLAFGLVLVVAVNFGWIMSSILYRHVELLNYLPVRLSRQGLALESATYHTSHVGFSTSGRLSSVLSIKADQDTTPVLRIDCDRSPGYLRARAFAMYRQSEWFDLSNREVLFPEQSRLFGMYVAGGANVFRLQERDPSECAYMTVRHGARLGDAVFTPLGTCFLKSPLSLLMRDDDDIVYAGHLSDDLSYRVAYMQSAYRRPPTDTQTRRMLNVPRHLDPRVRQLATEVFAGCATTSEKVDAIKDHFRTNYTYSLGLNIPSGRDKLTHFLLHESTGYCEYFASGAAILLRLAGVPTRYVTGFLVTEKDPQGRAWIARNMDAHAWVEAWDQERNEWITVEATAQEGVPTASTSAQSQFVGSGSGATLGQVLQTLYQYGILGVIGWLLRYGGLYTGLLLLACLLGGILWFAVSRCRRSNKSVDDIRRIVQRRPEIVTLHHMLAMVDRKVNTSGARRGLSETLHTFSQRLRTLESGDGAWTRISDWYLEYGDLRYCGSIAPNRLRQLRQRAQRL
jgi:transglutaminase-like putative cysteine protease